MEKEITVTTDDPTNPVMSLHVKANIVGSIDILPRAFLILPSPPNNDYSAKILVRKEKSEKGELNITEAKSTVPWLTAKARKVEKDEPPTGELPAAQPGDFIVEVSVTDETAIVQSGQQLTFKTGLTRETQATVPVSVGIQQPLAANPTSLVLMALDGAKEASGTIDVMVRANLASQPLTASVTPQAFSVKLVPDGPRHYKATVDWKSGDTPEKLGAVTFTVTGETLRVPIRIRDKSKLPPGPQAPEAAPGALPTPNPGAPGAGAQKPG